jgi:hypothetical protein
MINLWIAANGDATKAIRLPTGNIGFYASSGRILRTADGERAYVSNEEHSETWLMNADGTNRKQLTSSEVRVCRRSLRPMVATVFAANKEGAWGIWRMNVDGNLVRLTQGPTDNYPSVTADGRWVIFTSISRDRKSLRCR